VSLPRFSSDFARLPGYALADIPEVIQRLREQGVEVIDLGAGDSDLPPPPAAVEALREAVGDPDQSRYAFQTGLPRFRRAVTDFMERRFGVPLDPVREVLPLLGSKEGIAKLPLAFLDPGDLGIIPDPGYSAYAGGIVLAGGEPYRVPLRPENDFLLPLDELSPVVLERAKLLYLNYPNNPTTAVAPRSYLREAVEVCRSFDLVLVHDLAYSELAFDGYRPPSVLEIDGADEVALEFHSLSKSFNMTGWRLGWAAGGEALIRVLSRLKTFTDTGPFLAVQAAGAAALEAYEEWVPKNVEAFRRRRDAAVTALGDAGFSVEPPRATMYLWIPVPGGGRGEAFARRALEEQGVVVMPGSALGDGGEGFFRIALTLPEERLREGAARLGRLLG